MGEFHMRAVAVIVLLGTGYNCISRDVDCFKLLLEGEFNKANLDSKEL
jgi:hypothetical protein